MAPLTAPAVPLFWGENQDFGGPTGPRAREGAFVDRTLTRGGATPDSNRKPARPAKLMVGPMDGGHVSRTWGVMERDGNEMASDRYGGRWIRFAAGLRTAKQQSDRRGGIGMDLRSCDSHDCAGWWLNWLGTPCNRLPLMLLLFNLWRKSDYLCPPPTLHQRSCEIQGELVWCFKIASITHLRTRNPFRFGLHKRCGVQSNGS